MGRKSTCKNQRFLLISGFDLINSIDFIQLTSHSTLSLIAAKYILPCVRNDPQINQCIKRSFNHLKPYLGKGLPEINVPALEPLLIEQMNMDNDAGAVRIKARFADILAKGASNYTIKEVRSDIKVNKYNPHGQSELHNNYKKRSVFVGSCWS